MGLAKDGEGRRRQKAAVWVCSSAHQGLGSAPGVWHELGAGSVHLPTFRFICESQGFCGWVFKGHCSPWAGCCSNHILMLTRSMKKLGFSCVRRYWNCCLILPGMGPTKSAKLEISCIKENWAITPSAPSVQTPFPVTDLQSWGPVNLSVWKSSCISMRWSTRGSTSCSPQKGAETSPQSLQLPSAQLHTRGSRFQGTSAVERSRATWREQILAISFRPDFILSFLVKKKDICSLSA